MIVFESKFGTSFFDKKNKVLTNVYHGRVRLDLVIIHLRGLADFYSTSEVLGVITDLTKVYGSFVNALSSFEKIYPLIAKKGLKYYAIILPEDIILDTLISKVTTRLNSYNIKTALFRTRQEAESWIESNIQNFFKN